MITSLKKNLFIALFILFLLLCTTFPVLTQAQLEVEYPDIPDTEQPSDLPSLVIYLYKFLIVFSGIVALGILVWGGIIWMLSGDDPSKVNEAKGRIFSGIAGIIIILSVYLILYAVNPELTIVNLREPLQPEPIPVAVESGFYICSTDVNCPRNNVTELENCLVENKTSCTKIIGSYTGNLKDSDFKVYLIPSRLFEEKHYLFMANIPTQKSGSLGQTYEKCSVIAEASLLSDQRGVGEIKFPWPEAFSASDPSTDVLPPVNIIMAGVYYDPLGRDTQYLRNEGSLPGPKFCEYRNCVEKNDCNQPSKIWGDESDYNYQITESKMAISFSKIIKPVREMKFNEIEIEGEKVIPDYTVVMWKEKDFKGECYLAQDGEETLDSFIHELSDIKELTCPDGSKKTDSQSSYPWTQIGSIVALPLGGPKIAMPGILNVPYYAQNNPLWKDKIYGPGLCSDGENSTIGSAACMPTAAAMVLSYFGKNVDVLTSVKFAVDNGYRKCKNGTGYDFFHDIANSYSLNYKTISANEIKEELENGNPVIVVCDDIPLCRPNSGNGGHAIVITGISEDFIFVNDPKKDWHGENGSLPIENLPSKITGHVFYR